jgi:hypothetical protein
MITPLMPALHPAGAGAYCDASALPEVELSPRLRTGNTDESHAPTPPAGAPNLFRDETREESKGFFEPGLAQGGVQ